MQAVKKTRKKRVIPPPGRKVTLAQAREETHRKYAKSFAILAK